MKRALDLLYRTLQVLLTLLMAALIFPVVLQIVARFSPSFPHLIWTEEVARLCFIWVIMIGAMIAVRDGTHFDLDLWGKPRSTRALALRRLFVHGAMLVMALIFVGFGYRFAMFGFHQNSELTGLNMLAIHIAWPLAGVAFTAFLSEKLWADWMLLRGEQRGPG